MEQALALLEISTSKVRAFHKLENLKNTSNPQVLLLYVIIIDHLPSRTGSVFYILF